MTQLRGPVCLFVASVLALAACGGGGSDADPVDTEPGVTSPTTEADAETDTTEVAETEPDVSADVPDEAEARCGVIVGVGEYDEVACDEPHDAEFAALAAAPSEIDDVTIITACAPAVDDLVGRPLLDRGFVVGAVVDEAAPEIECWAEATGEATLAASLRSEGLEAALGDFVLLEDLEPGSCFVLAGASYDIAATTGCDDEGAEMLYARFEAEDGPIPDDDTVDRFFETCEAQLGDIELIGNSAYIISPLGEYWEAVGNRSVRCVAWTDPDVDTETDTTVADPTTASGPVCGNFDEALGDYPPVPCDQPHSAEFAGVVTPPDGNLPDDAQEASILLRRLCADPIAELTGRDISATVVGVGFVSPGGLGEPMVDDIQCWTTVEADGAFTGSISDVGYEEALNGVIIADLEPGTCFDFFSEDEFSLGEVVDCSADGVLMAIGTVNAEEPAGAPYPGDDPLRDERDRLCGELLSSSDLQVDPASVSGTFPDELTWLAHDRRLISCDAVPA